MNYEDSAKLGFGVALMGFGLTLVARSLSSTVAVEYCSPPKKTHHRNDGLLRCVDVASTDCKPSKGSQTNDDEAKKIGGIAASSSVVGLNGLDNLHADVIDDGAPVNGRDVFIRVPNNWLTRFFVSTQAGFRFGFAHAHSLKRLKLENINRNGGAA